MNRPAPFLRYLAPALLGLALAAPSAASELARGESAGMAFRVELLAEGLGVPWGMDFLAPQRLLVTQRDGRIHRLDLDSGRLTPIQGGPRVLASGQGGLLDVAVSPDGSDRRQTTV